MFSGAMDIECMPQFKTYKSGIKSFETNFPGKCYSTDCDVFLRNCSSVRTRTFSVIACLYEGCCWKMDDEWKNLLAGSYHSMQIKRKYKGQMTDTTVSFLNWQIYVIWAFILFACTPQFEPLEKGMPTMH